MLKYIMFQDENGAYVPILFHQILVHSVVAKRMKLVFAEQSLQMEAVSAGFCVFKSSGGDVLAYGESESLKLKSDPADSLLIRAAAR